MHVHKTCARGREGQGEGERESQVDSALSVELDTELHLKTLR